MSGRWIRPKTLRRLGFGAAGMVGLGALALGRLTDADSQRVALVFIVVGAFVLVLLGRLVWRRHSGSAGQVHRWSRRSRRNDGVASTWTLLQVASWIAVRRRATVVRPSFAQVPSWRRWLVPTTEFATALARVGWLRIWSPVEDVTVRIGGPRTGKTGELAGRIVEAPGALIATSTRTDLVYLTGPIRALRGTVHVFNPSGLGGLESTITFDPLSGCTEPRTAVARATDLISGVSSAGRAGDMEFWQGQARRVLAALLHAAALDRATMRDVLSWVADPDGASGDIQRALRHSAEPAFGLDAQQFLGTNERTRSSICSTIMPALGWLTDATAAEAASGGDFDVERLLDDRGTVFMLGADDGQVAPLVTALTGHIAREARRLAGHMPAGRLDPPLTLALDEAALICPIPLDNWTADMGGRGVTIQSPPSRERSCASDGATRAPRRSSTTPPHQPTGAQDGDGVAVRLPEVFVGGEGLARGPADVLGTLLHEAAHALAHVRGIKDTSRQGRWHNARFKALAEEIGIQVTRDASIGWSPLHLERFRPKEGALDGANQPFEVELDASGISVTVGADETMAEAIEAAGVDLPTFCREGTCGTCETYVLVTSLSVSCRRFCSLGSPPVQPPHEQLPVAAGAQCDDRTGTPGSLPARNHPGGSPGGRRGGEGPAPAPLADRRAPSNASLDQLLDRYLATLDVTS